MSSPAAAPPAGTAVPSPGSFLDRLGGHATLASQLVHRAYLEGQEGSWAEPDDLLPRALEEALAAQGVERLWSHQAAGLDAVARGEDLLVTTPTASGKSAIFQLPVLQAALAGEAGRALWLFPLKALGRDQRTKLEALGEAAGLEEAGGGAAPLCAIFDGDTPPAERAALLKDPPRVLITNPDMLHLGLLSRPDLWRPFLAELAWIVLDELHTYRGIFGSHFHHVLVRLLRQQRRAAGEGAPPRILASSATAANAADFAEGLTGRRFTVIEASGAPRQGRHLLLFQPATSPYATALDLVEALAEEGLKTIVFTKARRITELLYSWLSRRRPDLARRMASYRAGFLPEERRAIEGRLASGELDGVISTSALEMGIDIGGLDACVLVGYPGSVMAPWQLSGRVGRAGRESVTALVALPDALDQYFLDHPQELVERPCERLVVDPDNPRVVRDQLLCAAAEEPLHRDRDAAYLERHGAVVTELLEAHELLEEPGGEVLFSVRTRPHGDVQIRGGGASWAIRDLDRDEVIGTLDGSRVLREAHEGAVYLHGGRQFQVRSFDPTAREVAVQAARLDYYTQPLTRKETEILGTLAELEEGPLSARLGRLKVTEWVEGYERRKISSAESLGRHGLDLPPTTFETVGFWWRADRAVAATLEATATGTVEDPLMGALHAAEHATIALLPTFALCDRGDLGGISTTFHPQVGSAAVFVYDGHGGGAGISAGVFERLPELLVRVRTLLEACPCEAGCPSCVHSPKCGNGNRPLDKAGAARTLRLLLGEEAPVVPLERPTPPALPSPRPVPVEAEASLSGGSPPAASDPEPKPEREPQPEPPEAATAPPAAEPAAPPVRPAERPYTALFDLETLRSAREVGGWGKIHRMGLALGVVCFLEENRFETYVEEQVEELIAALKGAELVIGFNSRRFDYRVLNGYTGEDYSRSLPTLDLMEDIQRNHGVRPSLNALAGDTLGTAKSADGLQSLAWVKEGRLDLVEEYCRQDVQVTKDLYLFGRREGHVQLRHKKTGRLERLAVSW